MGQETADGENPDLSPDDHIRHTEIRQFLIIAATWVFEFPYLAN